MPTFTSLLIPFNTSVEFHELRFDWSSSFVSIYVDSVLFKTFTENIPTTPRRVILNQWSDTNLEGSSRPSERDSVSTVGWFRAYINSSDTKDVKKWEASCWDGKAKGRTCEVNDESGSVTNGTTVESETPKKDYPWLEWFKWVMRLVGYMLELGDPESLWQVPLGL